MKKMVSITFNNTVKSRTYQLIQPRELNELVIERPVRKGEVVVESTLASICHADLRYYTGNRRPEALAKKLPMALIHEGIGRIVESQTPDREIGQRVVIVPNLPAYLLEGKKREECCQACREGVGDNYCSRGRFLGSGTDGIAQNRLVLPAACTVPIPDSVPDEIAVLTELSSVSYHAFRHVKDRLKKDRVAVFGDGPVGYLTASVLAHIFEVTKDRFWAFGAIPDKIAQFEFAQTELVTKYDFKNGVKVDIVVECTGGRFSESAINQAIDILNPGGVLILMGVTEERVPINTRDVLEKGLTLMGSSRSSAPDYYQVIEAMKKPTYQATLRRILPDRFVQVNSIEDFKAAMEEASKHRDWKKTILQFHW
jgi:ribitol-5-phosphate 2-dehydrogenase